LSVSSPLVRDLLASGRRSFSFEFFPPKDDEGERQLWQTIRQLESLRPSFVSVTYGAGGSTREKTIDIVSRIHERFGLEAMAHLTCVNATVDELRQTVRQMRDAGVENVLALRGDPPQGQDRWTQTDGGLEFSHELVTVLREEFDVAIGAAAFPETHIHATSPEDDLRHLKAKVDAGAQFLITQMFFDNAYYFDFVARARAAGIDVPIIPGVMPILSSDGIKRMTELSAARLPDGLVRRRRGRGRAGRLLRHAAVRRAAGRRRAGHPFPHAEPLARHARDPQRPEAAPPVGSHRDRRGRRARLGLDRQLLGDGRGAVGAVVAHVDAVVLAVGPHAERAQQPAPAADVVDLQVAVEHQGSGFHAIVAAQVLVHAVEVDLERRAHVGGQAHDGPGHRPASWQQHR